MDVVSEVESRSESILFIIDRAFEVPLDALQDNFSYYFCDSRVHVHTWERSHEKWNLIVNVNVPGRAIRELVTTCTFFRGGVYGVYKTPR